MPAFHPIDTELLNTASDEFGCSGQVDGCKFRCSEREQARLLYSRNR
jgi:hypothetical protein